METTNMNLTGKASIDKPWLKYYPEELHNMETPKITLEEFLKMKNPDDSKIAFEYYGNKITWKTLWEEVDKAAKSLKVLGFGDGNRLPMFLPSTPAHYIILLAVETIFRKNYVSRSESLNPTLLLLWIILQKKTSSFSVRQLR